MAVPRFLKVLALLLPIVLTPALSAAEQGSPQRGEPRCDVGPLTMNFGNTAWLVYSCSGDRNLVIVSAPGNPAMPFNFVFYPTEDGYRLYGEGMGDRRFTKAAFDDLRTLSEQDVVYLIALTQRSRSQTSDDHRDNLK